jgi:hypothetical protein
VSWRAGFGLDWGSVDVHAALAPSSWCFVPARHVIDPRLSSYIVPAQRNVTLIRTTVHVTNYTFIGQRIVNQSLKPGAIGRAVGRPIHRYPLEPADAPDAPRGGKVRGGKFVVYRPAAERGARDAAPPERIEPGPAARAPRGHQQRLGGPSRPQPYPTRPARASEEPRETDPNGPPGQTAEEHGRGRPDRPAPGRRHGSSVAPPPTTPPAAPPESASPAGPAARENKPERPSKTPPERTGGGGGDDSASKRGKPKQAKPKSGDAECDKEKGNCPEGKPD